MPSWSVLSRSEVSLALWLNSFEKVAQKGPPPSGPSPMPSGFSNPVPTLGSITAPAGPSWIVVPVGVVNDVQGIRSPDWQLPDAAASMPPSLATVVVLVVLSVLLLLLQAASPRRTPRPAS